jgi:hypothetical protein
MHIRKALTVGAAVVAAGLLSLTATSTASNPTGGSIATVMVEGDPTSGTVPFNGVFKSGAGSIVIGGVTYSCLPPGTVAGSVVRGPVGGGPELSFSAFTLTCNSPIPGFPVTISINTAYPGCNVSAKFVDPNVHNTTVDTGTGTKFSRVDGTMQGVVPYPPGGVHCLHLTTTAGCQAWGANFATNAYFDEALVTVSSKKYQYLILDGAAFTLLNQGPACLGLLAGTVAFSNVTFYVERTGGTTTGIDFRP